VAEQGQSAAGKSRTQACERLGWGSNSPSFDWWGQLGPVRTVQTWKVELNFKISQNKSCRANNQLQLLQRPTYQILNRFGDKLA
jgi:hypothetical protein